MRPLRLAVAEPFTVTVPTAVVSQEVVEVVLPEFLRAASTHGGATAVHRTKAPTDHATWQRMCHGRVERIAVYAGAAAVSKRIGTHLDAGALMRVFRVGTPRNHRAFAERVRCCEPAQCSVLCSFDAHRAARGEVEGDRPQRWGLQTWLRSYESVLLLTSLE